MSSQQEIYNGLWTNWAEGRIVGATLTVSRRDGAYLIAFLALFVHVAGASFWRLASHVIFQSQARPSLDDGVTLQQQAVLRNSASAITGLRGFLKIFVRSRKLRKNLPMLLWSGLNFAFFLAAGILSSKVTSTQSDVLLLPNRCGPWWSNSNWVPSRDRTDLFNAAVFFGAMSELRASSCKKASTCYGENSVSNSCVQPGRRALSWRSSVSSNCPFGNLCVDETLSLDSGFLDSDLDLGINSPAEDRISLRLGLHCAPLKQDNYMEIYTGRNISSLLNERPWEKAERVFYQPTEQFGYEAFFYGPTRQVSGVKSPATFIFNNGTIASSMSPELVSTIVSLKTTTAEFDSSSQLIYWLSEFEPLEELSVPSSQVTLLFLSIGPWFSMSPVTDPWFRMNRPQNFSIIYSDSDKIVNFADYRRQPYTTVLGCASNSEICHGTSDANRQCTSILSNGTTPGSRTVTEILGLSERQSQIAQRVCDAKVWSGFSDIVQSTGGPGLLATQYMSNGGFFEAPLPNNQWQLEVQNFFAGVLVMLESLTKSYVTGAPLRKSIMYKKPGKDEQWMCNNQVIQSADYASFNVLGLCIILFVGGAAIALNLFDNRLCRLILRKTEINKHRQDSWEKTTYCSFKRPRCRPR